MVSSLLLGFLLHSNRQAVTTELFRGATVREEGYWAVTDTYLDSSDADKPKGGLFTLEGGKGRTILIKFGDLEHAIPQFAKITKATLYLSPSSSDQPTLSSIGMVKAPWGEGPMFVVPRSQEPEPAAQWGATWKQRRCGRDAINWQQDGANSLEDVSPIKGATQSDHEKEIAIDGLAETVQRMRDRWYENNGFAIQFSSKCEFFSSQAKNGRPRLVVEYTLDSASAGADLSVQWIDRDMAVQRNGDDATYRAAVKNVGSVAATAFEGQWIIGERPGSRFAVAKALQPGEETIVELKKPLRYSSIDHRINSLMLRVYPGTAEPNSNNDAASIDESAIPIAYMGAKVNADGLQAELRRLHETYFEQSRFSFAPYGVIESVRWVPAQADGALVIDLAGGQTIQRTLEPLTGLRPINSSAQVEIQGRSVRFNDPYPGVSGFGDTRNEGLIPPGIPMIYAPVASPLFDNLPIEPTGLLSATEVAAINMAIGRKGKAREGVLWDLPSTIILRATDMTGKPLDGAELAFYQLDRDVMPDTPTKTILTKEGGTVILESRDVPSGVIDKDALHQLKRNPFGNLRPDGSNGTILIRAQINGESEWGWLKAWQLSDAYHRGNKAAAIVDVRFNVPSGPLDRTTNLAKGKLVTDKGGSLPAKMAALVDDNPATEVTLGGEKGDWIEIDLGRDRPIGEIRLVLPKPLMPSKYDIQVYSTGQTTPDTEAWVKDLDFKWTLSNFGGTEGTSVAIPFRGPAVRGRYVRIVNRSGGAANIGEIRVVPLKAE